MNEIINYLLPVLIMSAGLLSTSVWILLKSGMATGWKLLMVPAALSIAVAMPLSISHLFGRALPTASPPERVLVLAHRTIITDGKKTRIEIWTAEPKKPTRLLSIPYSQPLEKQLEEAAAARQLGFQTELRRKRDGAPRTGQQTEEFTLDFKRPEDMMEPKDTPPTRDLLDERDGTRI